MKAWRFSAATDTDGNGLIENTKVGHGWTEGSPPYPPHEEIYLQGIWIEACRRWRSWREVHAGHGKLAADARAWAERTRAAVEKTYWLDGPGYYAFATALREAGEEVRRGARARAAPRRQARIEALRGRTLVDEDTVLPAVPLWWRRAGRRRARESEIDHLGSASHRHRLGRAAHLGPQRALRPAVVPLRLGLGALHGLVRRSAPTATAARTSATRP